MGTGKSRAGRQVAQRLGRPFVDMDAEIEARAGKPIPRIFAEEGEAAFRRLEAELCRELAARRGLVIATGGGALVDPANRAAMMQGGTAICLTCDPGQIVARLAAGGGADRPLLAVADPRAEVDRLLAARRPAYEAIPWQVDTTGLSVDEVAERLARFAQAVTLPVRPGSVADDAYPIHVGPGLLGSLGSALRAAGVAAGTRLAIVSNPVVEPLYGARTRASLEAAGLTTLTSTIPDGEAHKTLATVASLYDQFLAGGLDRSSLVLSLGGGVTGDLAGFAAATFMRGLPFAQVPTSLLAMVDASVGGKTGADLPQGKNLVGAFKQPRLVLVDPELLATPPLAEFRSGMAELLQHGILGDPDLFAQLESPPSADPTGLPAPILARALQVKIDVVEADPFEQGRRAVLNLGHTTGHALEQISGYRLRHGEAVAIGLVAAARIAAALGRADVALAGRIEAALTAWGLPTRIPAGEPGQPFTVGAIWAAMAHDKKRRGRAQRWVLPQALGRVEIAADVPPEVVKSVLRDLGARSEP